jgi:PTS system ascorbate-specific IIA component
MTGILIFTQKDLGAGLLHSIEHVLGSVPPGVETFAVDYYRNPEQTERALREAIARFPENGGVLILADIYGASHTNAARRLLQPGCIEMVCGVNLPMVIRVLNYRDRDCDLVVLAAKARSGGVEGIVSCSRQTAPES